MLRRGFLFALAHGWRELREIGNGYVNVGHGTRVILSVSSLGLSGGQELTITTDVFSFPCYQFPFVFTHINKWIQKHTTPFSPHPHIISATWTWVHKTIKSALQSLLNGLCADLKYSHKAYLCHHYRVRTLGWLWPWTMDMTSDQREPPMRQQRHKQYGI